MPLEVLTGSDVPALLTRAQEMLGESAVVLSVRRIVDGRRLVFEMVAADPVTAERHQRRHPAPPFPAQPDVLATAPAPGTRAAAPAAAGPRAPEPARPREPLARPAERTSAAADEVTSPGDAARFWDLGAAPAKDSEPLPRPLRRRRGRWPFRSPAADERQPWIVALVGPTGAGKTTTIAKLANHPRAFAGRSVGLLCLDTYRIGAVEQARQYAELSRLPLEVVWDAREIPRAVRRLRECDVVLIDTPGRGPRAAADLEETQARLARLRPNEVHLVIPAGLQRSLARRLVTAHMPLGVTHMLPTKLDEFPDERGVFELAAQFGLPMRWLADGQEVPRDLQVAPAERARAQTLMEVA